MYRLTAGCQALLTAAAGSEPEVGGVIYRDLAMHDVAFREPIFTVLAWDTSGPYNKDSGRADKAQILEMIKKLEVHAWQVPRY